jgi:tetratricopeptide (TPR) repeat protein
MKKVTIVLSMVFFVLGTTMLTGQQTNVDLPQVSQKAKVMQRVGLTDITIAYHSPQVNKREIWGKLVPYDKMWRAGANDNTTISFTHDVKIEGQPLAKGAYGFHTIPGKDEWTLVFSKNHTSLGSFFYKKEEDALRVKVKPVEAPFREWLTYDFTDREKTSAVASIHWEKLRVPFKIEVDVHNVVIASLKKQLRGLPWFFWRGTFNAAKYCHDNDVNMEEALTWIGQSIRRKENFNNVNLKSQILEKLGKTAEAATAKKHAFKIASEQELTNYAYSFARSDKAKCEKILMENITRFKSWFTYRAIARYFQFFKDNANALKYFKLALKKAPTNEKKALEDAIKKLG